MNQRPPKQRISDSTLDHLRVPPHSIEAEQSVLGGLLLDNQAWDRIGDQVAQNDSGVLKIGQNHNSVKTDQGDALIPWDLLHL